MYFVRRLLKDEKDKIIKAFAYLNKTYYNPVNSEFVDNVFLKGEWWGVFLKDELISASWIHNANEEFYIKSNSYWNIKDVLEYKLEDVMVCGYIYSKENSEEVYSLLLNIYNMQSIKKGKSILVHTLSAYEIWALKPIFMHNFNLIALRGLENVTPHYLFLKKAGLEEVKREERTVEKLDIKNTKEISRLLEKRYTGFKFKEGKIHFFKK